MAEEGKPILTLRLYVANDTIPSRQARANLDLICREHFPDSATVEIVDILKDPIRCLNEGVLVTPTLIKVSPPPARKIVGTLSETMVVLLALGMKG